MVISQIILGQTTVQRLDSLFNYLHNNQLFNGNVLVAEKGNVVYQNSLGYADYATKTPLQKDSRFHLASVTKTFTAVAILQLKEKGKLKLEDKLKTYFPDFPYANISIRHLLSHTSGLRDDVLFDSLVKDKKIIFNKDIIPALKILKIPLLFEPGENWEYSNTNFLLLTSLIEKLSGLSYQDYLQKNIFAPSKMTNSYVLEDALHYRKDGFRVTNHKYPELYSDVLVDAYSTEPYLSNHYYMTGAVGDGSIMSTTEDLLKYDQSLYTGKLLKPETLNEALTPTMLNNGKPALFGFAYLGKMAYGLGWCIIQDTSQGKIVCHTGAYQGSKSILLRNLSKQQTFIAFDNTDNIALLPAIVNASNILNNIPLIPITKSLAQEYARVLAAKDEHAAFTRYIQLQNDSLHYNKRGFEDDNNQMGYRLSFDSTIKRYKEKSLAALQLNVLLFPKSWNVYDSYAYVLDLNGYYIEAIAMYEKSIELNPENETGKEELKKVKAKLK